MKYQQWGNLKSCFAVKGAIYYVAIALHMWRYRPAYLNDV